MFKHIKSALSMGLAAALVAGCASTSEAMDDAADLMGADEGVIVVDNTDSTVGSATIYLVPETGTREMIGVVDPNGEAEFTVEPEIELVYRLVADIGTEEIVSREFSFTENSALEWDLGTNQVLPVNER